MFVSHFFRGNYLGIVFTHIFSCFSFLLICKSFLYIVALNLLSYFLPTLLLDFNFVTPFIIQKF